MALAAAAAAATTRRLASSGGLTKIFRGIRRHGDQTGVDTIPSKDEIKLFLDSAESLLRRAQSMPQDEFGNLLKDLSKTMSNVAPKSVPSKDEIKLFVDSAKSFLRRAQSMPQDEFGDFLKDLSKTMSDLALDNGILYPTELSNLVDTFVPVLGTYMPHNSKVVAVDLVQRMKAIETSTAWKWAMIIAVLTTFGGGVVYWPYVIYELRQEDKHQDELITGMQTRMKPMEELTTALDGKVETLDGRVKTLERKAETLEEKGLQASSPVMASSPEKDSRASDTSWSTWSYAACATIGGVAVAGLFFLLK